MPTEAGLSLSLYDQDGNYVGNLESELDVWRLSTVINGGCLACVMRLPRAAKLNYPDLGFPYDVRVSDARGVFWRGTLELWEGDFQEQEEGIDLTALNVNASLQSYTSKTFTAATAIETCVSTVRTDLLQKVTAESLVATSRTLNGNLTVAGKRAREVLDLLCQHGNSSDALLQWAIWPDGTDAALQLALEVRPTTPGYSIHIEDLRGKIAFDGAAYANRQRVRYNNNASWAVADDTTEQGAGPAGKNRIQEGDIIDAPDVTDATDAGRIATTVLTTRKVLRPTASPATVAAPWAITDGDGQEIPLWRVRAGKLLEVRGPQPISGSNYNWRNALYIARTEYDVFSGVLSLTFESLNATLEGMIARLVKRTTL